MPKVAATTEAHANAGSNHLPTLCYYTSDDGVYLQCKCGWSHNLGFDAFPEDAVAAAVAHRDAVYKILTKKPSRKKGG